MLLLVICELLFGRQSVSRLWYVRRSLYLDRSPGLSFVQKKVVASLLAMNFYEVIPPPEVAVVLSLPSPRPPLPILPAA